MQIIDTPSFMSTVAQQLRSQGTSIALVPTMGNLHAGHLSLIEKAKPLANKVIVSIFVNPTQFGPQEDFGNYPRTLENDCAKLESMGVDYVFAPQATDMYPGDSFVKVPGLSDILCGAFRPGHFQGVATIVCKLLQITQANIALFGQKDYQQLLVIKRMVTDLCLPVKILGAPIVREKNGLAMSSRNQYLSEAQRDQAATLHRELQSLVEQAQTSHDYVTLTTQARDNLNHAGFNTDYITVRRQDNLQEPSAHDKQLIVLAAALLGKTRLIDNIIFECAEGIYIT